MYFTRLTLLSVFWKGSELRTAPPCSALLRAQLCEAVNNATGAQTQMAGLVTALVMLCRSWSGPRSGRWFGR